MNKELMDKANNIIELLKNDKGTTKLCSSCKKYFLGVSPDTTMALSKFLSMGIKECDDFCLDCLERESMV